MKALPAIRLLLTLCWAVWIPTDATAQERVVVKTLAPVAATDGANVKLLRYIGGKEGAISAVDPFLVLDCYNSTNPDDFSGGFPAHPHRGFTELRYLLEGELRHEDGCGGKGHISGGGAQLLFTGAGIAHEELVGGTKLKGFQLWVNVPAVRKIASPVYRSVSSFDVHRTGKSEWKLLSGQLGEVEGPFTDLHVGLFFMDVKVIEYDNFFAIPTAVDDTAIVFCYKGTIDVGSDEETMYSIMEGESVVLSRGTTIALRSLDRGDLGSALVITAPPIREPVFVGGGFVGNSRSDINAAYQDLEDGRSSKCAESR